MDVLRAVFGRFLPPDEPPDDLPPPPSEPAAAAETVVPSERASSSAAESWNHLARHCCAVRFFIVLEMALQFAPCSTRSSVRRRSSFVDHCSRLIPGSRWRRQRPMHCWSVRPGIERAMSAQRRPCVFTSSWSCEKSEGREEREERRRGGGERAGRGGRGW